MLSQSKACKKCQNWHCIYFLFVDSTGGCEKISMVFSGRPRKNI